MLTASIFNVIWLIAAFTQIVDIKAPLRTTCLISPLPYMVLDIGFGGATVISSILAVVFIAGIILSLIGGILAVRKRKWGLSLAGSIGTLVLLSLSGCIGYHTIMGVKKIFFSS
jgi:hypothetical protein